MSWWLSALLACVAFLAGTAVAGWTARRKRDSASVAKMKAGSPASPLAVFERLTDPILLLDERGNMGRASSAAIELFGQASLEPGRPFTALLHEDDVAAARDALECVVSGVELDDSPLWRFWIDGGWQPSHVQLTSFLDDPAVRAVAMILRPKLPVAR
ncbi:MAG TPA: PAS domain-containing protein, partial [Gemmatimonadaceae bacterium]|nr:PAS domain-containing protein [Gemmatimonadaceae bacterium]